MVFFINSILLYVSIDERWLVWEALYKYRSAYLHAYYTCICLWRTATHIITYQVLHHIVRELLHWYQMLLQNSLDTSCFAFYFCSRIMYYNWRTWCSAVIVLLLWICMVFRNHFACRSVVLRLLGLVTAVLVILSQIWHFSNGFLFYSFIPHLSSNICWFCLFHLHFLLLLQSVSLGAIHLCRPHRGESGSGGRTRTG